MHRIVCMIFGHGKWQKEKTTLMLPRRRCSDCDQIQVQLPKVGCATPGKWVNHED